VCITDAVLDESAIIRRLCTIGEISQLCPSLTPSRVFMLVHSLVAAPTITSVGQLHEVLSANVCFSPLFTILSQLGVSIRPHSSAHSGDSSTLPSRPCIQSFA